MNDSKNLVLALLTLSLAVLMGYQCWSDFSRASDASSRWQRTSGLVDSAHYDTMFSGRYRTTPTYIPHVTYHFDYGGQAFTGEQIAFPNPVYRDDDTVVKALMSDYPPGGLVSIYFDPANPNRSCLKPGGSSGLNYQFLLLFILLICVTFFAFFKGSKSEGV